MLEPADHTLITQQMDKAPRGVLAVAARCPAGHPAAVTCYPLRTEGQRVVPFPTLYWLTCPRLCAQVSHLERDGTIAALQAELARDQDLQAGLRRDHEDYISQRWATLTRQDQHLVSELGLLEAFQTRGIGGMSNHMAVKCLHVHLAHELASGNVIGQLLLSRYGVRTCGNRGGKSS